MYVLKVNFDIKSNNYTYLLIKNIFLIFKMKGTMMERPMLIYQILEYAALYYPDQEIVSRSLEGPIHRYTYKDALIRTKKLAEAL